MKKLTVFIFLLIPTMSIAQNYPGMSEADMQKMMQQMQKMESCLENVDESKLKALEQRTQQMEAKVKSLCAGGKHDQAQKEAMAFGTETANDPTIKTMMKCGEMMKDVMPEISFAELAKEGADHHVCE